LSNACRDLYDASAGITHRVSMTIFFLQQDSKIGRSAFYGFNIHRKLQE